MLPFTAPLAECVVFEAVSFEVFWPWILGRYLRPAHPNVARSMWKAMGDRTSTPATLAEDGYEFTRLIPRSNWMDAVLRGDEEAMRNPVLNDTVELALSFWPNSSAQLAGALNYYTVSPHATGSGSTPYFCGGELEAARLLTLEATVQGMALDARLQACHQAPDYMALSMSWPPTCPTLLRPMSSSIAARPGSVWRAGSLARTRVSKTARR
jgi:hypothetical protein